MENEIRTLRGILRRMLYVTPGLKRVASRGTDASSFAAAAEAEGLTVDRSEPEGYLVWAPGETLLEATPPGTSARTVSVVASEISKPPLAHPLAKRQARISTSLREWVARWPSAAILRPFLAPDAVGKRTCNASLKGSHEWTFVHEAPKAGVGLAGGRKRELTVTFFSSGFFPIMPATLASALLVPPALAIHTFLGGVAFQAIALAVAVTATVASVLLERWAASWFLAEDPREFVLDEVAGMAFTWALLPPDTDWPLLLLAFFLFRLFDIFKWGVSWIESLPIRGKIVWDDLLAGFYAGLCCLLLGSFF